MNEQLKRKPLAAAVLMAMMLPVANVEETTSPISAPAEPADVHQLPPVEVRAGRNTIDERQQSPASKLVYDRKDLERYNELTVGKLPGISFGGPPGRSNDIRMRGFEDGYTQILFVADAGVAIHAPVGAASAAIFLLVRRVVASRRFLRDLRRSGSEDIQPQQQGAGDTQGRVDRRKLHRFRLQSSHIVLMLTRFPVKLPESCLATIFANAAE